MGAREGLFGLLAGGRAFAVLWATCGLALRDEDRDTGRLVSLAELAGELHEPLQAVFFLAELLVLKGYLAREGGGYIPTVAGYSWSAAQSERSDRSGNN